MQTREPRKEMLHSQTSQQGNTSPRLQLWRRKVKRDREKRRKYHRVPTESPNPICGGPSPANDTLWDTTGDPSVQMCCGGTRGMCAALGRWWSFWMSTDFKCDKLSSPLSRHGHKKDTVSTCYHNCRSESLILLCDDCIPVYFIHWP